MKQRITKLTKEQLQNKKQILVENAKTQITVITKKIEDEVRSVENNASVIEGDLLTSQQQTEDKNISFSQELARKTVHFLSLLIPISYIFLSKELVLMILVPAMLSFVIVDIITKRVPFLRSLYLKTFGGMLRKHEIKAKKILLNGASWVLISAILTIYFFPKIIAIVALSVLIISDVVAALVGRKYGKNRFLGIKKKSWEGTIAFFVSASIVVLIYGLIFNVPLIYYFIGVIASIVAALAEAISKKILRTDDNLAIPISFGIIMWTGNVAMVFFYNVDFANWLK